MKKWEIGIQAWEFTANLHKIICENLRRTSAIVCENFEEKWELQIANYQFQRIVESVNPFIESFALGLSALVAIICHEDAKTRSWFCPQREWL